MSPLRHLTTACLYVTLGGGGGRCRPIPDGEPNNQYVWPQRQKSRLSGGRGLRYCEDGVMPVAPGELVGCHVFEVGTREGVPFITFGTGPTTRQQGRLVIE